MYRIEGDYPREGDNSRARERDYSREGDYSREAIISNISHRSSCPVYFVLLYQAIKEKVKYMNITKEKNCT